MGDRHGRADWADCRQRDKLREMGVGSLAWGGVGIVRGMLEIGSGRAVTRYERKGDETVCQAYVHERFVESSAPFPK